MSPDAACTEIRNRMASMRISDSDGQRKDGAMRSWYVFFTLGGYYFGNMPLVKNNFTVVILAIIFISVLPGIIEYLRQRRTSAAS